MNDLSHEILQNQLTRPFKYFEAVGSANDIARLWLDEGAPDGAVVIANEQRRGRGRKGRRWHTPPNTALALSIILRPPPQCLSRISLIGALSVYDLAKHVGCADVGIKWPNDVQVNRRKVGGILPEVAWERGKPRGAVLGIGLNVRVDFSRTAFKNTAISLETAASRPLNRAQLIDHLLRRVDSWYGLIASDALFAAWKNRLNMLGRRVKTEAVEGLALDVQSDGSLLVRDDSGRIHSALAGDLFAVSDREGD